MKEVEVRDGFKKAFELYMEIREKGPSFFEQKSVDMVPWFNSKPSNINDKIILNRDKDKEVIILSSQRSGSTLFSQMIMKDISCGIPREHFNHAFRGDYGNHVSFSDIWELGRKGDIVSHKIMASDFSRLASTLGISGCFGKQVEGLAEFFTVNPSHFFYRVKRENFFDQYQSSMTAQLTGIYFGQGSSDQNFNIDEKSYRRFIDTWLSLKSSEVVLDWLWAQLSNKRLVKYETDLKEENQRNSLLALVANDLKFPFKKYTSVSLAPPTTTIEKQKNKRNIYDFLKRVVDIEEFELYFGDSLDL